MNISIRAKVVLALSVAFILLFSLTSYLVVTNTTSLLRTNLNEEPKSFASLATTPIGNTFILYQSSGTVRIRQEVSKFLSLDPNVTAISVLSTDGTPLFSNRGQTGQPVSPADAAAFQPVYKYAPGGYISQIIEPLIEATGVHRFAIVYQISTQRAEQAVTNEARLILLAGAAFLVLSIVGTSLMLNRLIVNPLRDLSKLAGIISAGNYNQQIGSKHHDEIGNLAAALNKMAESLKADIVKLEELDKLKSEFMMITSHNLRTPLTIMKGNLELAESAESADELKTIVSNVGLGVGRLNMLAEEILTISTLEAGNVMPRAAVPLKAYLQSINDEFAPLAAKKGLQWQFMNHVPDKTELLINRSNMQTALASILDNAIKFTESGGKVVVEAKLLDNWFEFKVKDNGVGIADSELPKVFMKFHRGTDTMHYNYDGEGIGLYLSRLIIEQHDGQIRLESKLGEGTTVQVKLPLAGNT